MDVKMPSRLEKDPLHWVRMRDSCSTSAKFEELCSTIRQAVGIRNDLSEGYSYSKGDNTFSVFRTRDDVSITFKLEGRCIVISGTCIKEEISLATQVNQDGKCILVSIEDRGQLDIHEIQTWRVIRVLDDLFFGVNSDRPR